jgi:hypothetical protein
MGYCGNHSINYSGSTCPRCDADERHRALLNATAEGLADTVDAMHASDYRRANPGDYQCPHCKYVALKSDATRCPLCRGEIDRAYWKGVRILERAEADRREIQAKQQRAADKAATRERERLAEIAQQEAEERRRWIILLSIVGIAAGCVGLWLFIEWLRQWLSQFSGSQIALSVFVVLMVIGFISRIFE